MKSKGSQWGESQFLLHWLDEATRIKEGNLF